MDKESSSSFQKTVDSFESPKFNKHTLSDIQVEKQHQKVQFLSNRQDDYRCPLAYSDGGFTCGDEKQIDKLRSVGKQMIKLIGKKILSGQLNLTKISFPIRACAPKTALKNSVQSCVVFPHFINRAAYCKDPLQRFKLACVGLLCSTAYIDLFLKPLNPIIGQTLQGSLKDGTKVYCQQISHHPPISYFLIYGPQNCYRFSGYYDFDISPGLNSLTMKNKGHRKLLFNDGTQIVANYASGVFSSTFIGTSRIQQTQSIQITDQKNNYKVTIQFGKVKKKPSDYFRSYIYHNQKQIQQIYGTYCGYIQINKKRYWDVRDFQALQIDYQKISQVKLKSSFEYRPDLILLKENKMEEAQKAKQHLEEIQRTDEKHRKKYRGILKQQQHHKQQQH